MWQLVRQLCACVCRAAPIRFLSPLDYEFLGKRGDVPYQSSGWAIKHERAHRDVEPRYVAADRERCVCVCVCECVCFTVSAAEMKPNRAPDYTDFL